MRCVASALIAAGLLLGGVADVNAAPPAKKLNGLVKLQNAGVIGYNTAVSNFYYGGSYGGSYGYSYSSGFSVSVSVTSSNATSYWSGSSGATYSNADYVSAWYTSSSGATQTSVTTGFTLHKASLLLGGAGAPSTKNAGIPAAAGTSRATDAGPVTLGH